jgi:hypothetical protein
MTIAIPRCPRPSEPGTYVLNREMFPVGVTVLIEVRRTDDGLVCFASGTSFPLNKIEASAVFWGPVELEPG